jgi:hypothetical protein
VHTSTPDNFLQKVRKSVVGIRQIAQSLRVLGARFRAGRGEKGWEMGIPGTCSSPAKGSTKNSTPGVGRRRRRKRARERGESAPGHPGDGAIGEGEHDWRTVVAPSGVVRSALGPGGAHPHRATPGPFLFLDPGPFLFFGSWAVPFQVLFLLQFFISFFSSKNYLLFYYFFIYAV